MDKQVPLNGEKRKIEGTFVGLMSIGHQPREQVDQKVKQAAMVRVFNLRNIF